MDSKRRELMSLLGAGSLAAVAAKAAALGPRPVTVVVFQRGAVDGLNMLVPHGDPDYRRLRPNVRVESPDADGGAIDLDGFFGLHPALQALHPYWQSGQLAAVHAVGSPHSSRSHFSAQEIMESGLQSETATLSGWLGRHLQADRSNDSPFRSVAISLRAPRSLQGSVPPLALQSFNVFDSLINRGDAFLDALDQLNAGDRDYAGQTRLATAALRELQRHNPSQIEPRHGARYPDSGFARSLQRAAQLIHAELGCEVIALDIGGWDTHVNQNPGLSARLRELAEGLHAFITDMGPRMAQVSILTMSEFGRRAHENGSAGTDHGHGSAMFAIGAGVNGGQVYGRWPGLAEEDLERGDLQVTTDYRTVLSEYLATRLANSSATLFPDYRPVAPLGLFRA